MRAPAKLNLCLYLGPTREDGRHELCSVFQPLELADQISIQRSGRTEQVVCPGIDGTNLAEVALAELRAAGWGPPPIRAVIEKRIPVAAGLGGGSADAAAVLRLGRGQVEGLERIAARIGADVPSQLDPVPALVRGAGERVEALAPSTDYGIVLIPDPRGLSTAEVYAEADRLGLQRPTDELEGQAKRLRDAFADGGSPLEHLELLVNDLQPAAISLMGEIEDALRALRDAGAVHSMVTGSGPTAVGLFPRPVDAAAARERLQPVYGGTIATTPAGDA